MIEFKTHKKKSITFGDNFINISMKSAIDPEGESIEKPFLAIERGYFIKDDDGNKGPRFIRTLTIPNNNGQIKDFMKALNKVIGDNE